ncbi:MAG: hypothetical protein R6X02_27335 [Enhygromyxa sp.]
MFACLLAGFGCGREQESTIELGTEATAVDPAGPPPGAHAVLAANSSRFADPSGVGVPLPGRAANRGYAVVVKSTRDGFIEVSTLPYSTPDASCAASFGFEQRFQLTFLVKPDALLPVLRIPKSIDFGDGSSVALLPGVPVIRGGPDGRVQVGGTILEVPLEDHEVGRWFTPSKRMLEEPASIPCSGASLHYGARALVADDALFEYANSRQPIEDRERLIFNNPCGTFTLLGRCGENALPTVGPATSQRLSLIAPGVMVQPGAESLASPSTLAEAEPSSSEPYGPGRWKASHGTAVTWASGGGPAGVVLLDHHLRRVEERGEQICFDASGFGLCIDADKLERSGEREDPRERTGDRR